MLIICYGISNDKLRTRLAKWLVKSGGIRLQYSVYEFSYTKRMLENIKIKFESDFCKKFGGGDSIFIFETNINNAIKFGNAIHRDKDLLFFT